MDENTPNNITQPADAQRSLQAARFGKEMPPLFAVGSAPQVEPSESSKSAPTGALKPDTNGLHVNLPRPESLWRTLLKASGVFVLTFVLVFALLQSPALVSRFGYTLTHLGKQSGTAPLAFLPKLQDRPVMLTEIKDHPEEYLAPSAQLAGYSLADLGDDQLLIPKIEVKVPVIWDSLADETTMLANLQKGVAHYGFTALPSDGRGKVFISGHSSYALWDPGKFKTVFANLDRLEIGDQLAVTFHGVVYLYEVTAKNIVKPSDVSVLDPTKEPTLALMTCVPVGTDRSRLVVETKLMSAAANRPVPLPPPGLRDDPASIFHYLTI